MNAEIITIGDELLIGQVVNTNQSYIAEKLNTVGIFVKWMTTVGDNDADIRDAFSDAWKRAEVACVTGGLGPTHDDITKRIVCEFFATDLVLNEDILRSVKDLLRKRNIAWTQAAHDQALVPRGCIAIENTVGTAPGMVIQKEGKYFIVMPGVPYEMKEMVDNWVIPFFERKNLGTVVRHLTLKTTGIPESLLATELGDIAEITGNDGTTTLAFLPSPLGTKLRLTVRETSMREAEMKLHRAEEIIRSKASKFIYSTDDRELEDIIGELLRERRLKLATAESCTGGMIANRITNVPGSSEYFIRGYIAYSNTAKTELIGVDENLMREKGAVSKEVAEAMAIGARIAAKTDIAISTTGIAGPTGGSPEKPVGLIWIGYSDARETLALKFNFGDHRLRFKERASQAALELLRRRLKP